MERSCCLWALTANQSHQTAIAQVAELGFGVIDVQPQTVEPAQVSAAGLRVSCVALSHGAPEDCSLDDEDASSLSRALSPAYAALVSKRPSTSTSEWVDNSSSIFILHIFFCSYRRYDCR